MHCCLENALHVCETLNANSIEHLPDSVMVRRHEPGKENHELDPRLGDFFPCTWKSKWTLPTEHLRKGNTASVPAWWSPLLSFWGIYCTMLRQRAHFFGKLPAFLTPFGVMDEIKLFLIKVCENLCCSKISCYTVANGTRFQAKRSKKILPCQYKYTHTCTNSK